MACQPSPGRLAHLSRRPKGALRCAAGVAEGGPKRSSPRMRHGLASFQKNAKRVTARVPAPPSAGGPKRLDGPRFPAGFGCSSVFHRPRMARGPCILGEAFLIIRGGPTVAGGAGEALQGQRQRGSFEGYHREAWTRLGPRSTPRHSLPLLDLRCESPYQEKKAPARRKKAPARTLPRLVPPCSSAVPARVAFMLRPGSQKRSRAVEFAPIRSYELVPENRVRRVSSLVLGF